jgi:hypothetical protein
VHALQFNRIKKRHFTDPRGRKVGAALFSNLIAIYSTYLYQSTPMFSGFSSHAPCPLDSFPSPTRTYHADTYASVSPSLSQLSTEGKSAFITGGGAGGIGASIAASRRRFGISTLGLLGRNESRLLEIKQTIQAISPKTTVPIYIADLIDQPAIQRAVSSFAAAVLGG